MGFFGLFRRKRTPEPDGLLSSSADVRVRDPRPLPQVSFETQLNYMKCFTSPSPDVKATLRDKIGTAVGRVTYAVSPLNDRVYIFDITVFEEHRRNGYGLATIDWLNRTYQLPMTTIKEVFSASPFWVQARLMVSGAGGEITTISVGEMPAEAERWAHLKTTADALESQITERFLHGESYESAVGRGLEPRS